MLQGLVCWALVLLYNSSRQFPEIDMTKYGLAYCQQKRLSFEADMCARDHCTGRPGTKGPGPRDRAQGPGPRDRAQGPGPRDWAQGPGPRDQGPGPGPRDQGPGQGGGFIISDPFSNPTCRLVRQLQKV